MAQIVDYYEKGVKFTEGPFVVSRQSGDDIGNPGAVYGIEAEKLNLPGDISAWPIDESIHQLCFNELAENYAASFIPDLVLRSAQVDWLNEQVRIGRIVKVDGRWIVPSPSPEPCGHNFCPNCGHKLN